MKNEGMAEEYDITAAPNDFNVLTIFSFLESGSVRIPGFQRNYVWDLGRASKLIESLVLVLLVPQVFLYEVERNKFLVIDGQQRLMSIYYFLKQRFPQKETRPELRAILDEQGNIPDSITHNDSYCEHFRLQLPDRRGKLGQPERGGFVGKKRRPGVDDCFRRHTRLRSSHCSTACGRLKINRPHQDDPFSPFSATRYSSGGSHAQRP